MSVLNVKNINKSYGTIKALTNFSLEVPKGCVFGILGPNGSGKTTLLSIITDVLKADSGSFLIFNENSSPLLRKQIGTLLETPNFYHYLTGYQNLQITAKIKGVSFNQIDQVLAKVNLFDRRNSKFSTYSLGMKQRLAIAGALLGTPKLLILDEPTNGLDPNGIADIRILIKQLAREGNTILIASHLLDEVEKVCTHVAIIKNGVLLSSGSVAQVLKNEEAFVISAEDLNKLAKILSSIFSTDQMEIQNNQIILSIPQGKYNLAYINQYCFENGIVLNHLSIQKKTLETKFLEITN